MNQLEKDISRLNEVIKNSYSLLYKLQAQLQRDGTCSHAKTVKYNWRHDDGYGRQTPISGQRCEICLAKDPWGSGRWSLPEVD